VVALALLMTAAIGVAGVGPVPAVVAVGATTVGIRAMTAMVVVSIASVGLGLGWTQLTGIPQAVLDRVVIVVAGVIASAGVTVWRDMSAVTVAAGLGLVSLIAVELLLAPAPREPVRPAAPAGPGTASGTRAWASTDVREDRGPTPMTVSLPAAATGALVSTAGACWVALAANPQWSATVVISCLVVLAVVVGDQVGHTYRSNSLGALGGGLVGGLLVAVAYWAAGRAGASLPRVLPVLAQSIGDVGAVVAAGLATGVSMALAVIAMDGLLGDHDGRRPSARGGLARGCAKFLVAVVPFYVMIRIGGV